MPARCNTPRKCVSRVFIVFRVDDTTSCIQVGPNRAQLGTYTYTRWLDRAIGTDAFRCSPVFENRGGETVAETHEGRNNGRGGTGGEKTKTGLVLAPVEDLLRARGPCSVTSMRKRRRRWRRKGEERNHNTAWESEGRDRLATPLSDSLWGASFATSRRSCWRR